MREIKRTIVSAIIFSKDDKVLMGKKDPVGGGVYPDCWHIPGGGIDEGETFEQAVMREVKEEVGIDISGYELSVYLLLVRVFRKKPSMILMSEF